MLFRSVLAALFLTLAALQVDAKIYTGADGKTADIKKSPARILALNSSNTEILFELGQGTKIVGTDVGAKFPEAATKIEKVGHPYRPSVEGMISLKPDLVVATEENLPAASAEQLRTAKIPVLVLPDSGKNGTKGFKERVTTLAEITGSQKEGTALLAKFDKGMAELDTKVKTLKKTPKVFFLYAHGPTKTFIYGKETGSHELIEAIGAKNAADFTTGTKPLTAEAMVQANPDVIIMLERGMNTVGGVDEVLKLPGVAMTPAGKNKKIFVVDDSIRWMGPRFPEFALKLFDQAAGI